MSNVKVKDAAGDTTDMLQVDGYRLPAITDSPEQGTEYFRGIRHLPCRDDDIMLVAPVKAGTHWIWEILGMLLSGKVENTTKGKTITMMENCSTATLAAVESPRVLNTHVSIPYLPEELFKGKGRIILLRRNPKDTVVSWYNHSKGFRCYKYNGKWENFLEMFLQDQLEYGSWFDNVLGWEKIMSERPDLPVYVLMYEDLKLDLKSEIARLSEWLGLSLDDVTLAAIADKCTFKSMVKDKVYSEGVKKRIFVGDFAVYRKGEIGDWKNWFTVAQNERFDQVYADRMKTSKQKFRYT